LQKNRKQNANKAERSKERKTAKEEKHELQLTLRETKKEGPENQKMRTRKKNSIAKAKREIW
jgi:hypothetical protein